MAPGTVYVLQCLPSGQIIAMDADGGQRRVLLDHLTGNVDGIVVDRSAGKLYWTNMGPAMGPGHGEFFQADGSIEVVGLDGAHRKALVGHGLIVTPKQLTADFDRGHLYWCDREGMRVMRSHLDGSDVTVLVRTGVFPADAQDVMRHCIGIAVDTVNGHVYWTQKGPPDGGLGRIFRAALTPAPDQSPETRTDIELLIDHLPEPIDLEIDPVGGWLYWTDRGDLAGGNSLNRARIGRHGLDRHEVIAEGLHEGIGLAVDHANGRAFMADLGGTVWVCALQPGSRLRPIATGLGVLTGVAFVPG